MTELRNPGVLVIPPSKHLTKGVDELSPPLHALILGVGRGGTTACAKVFRGFGFTIEGGNDFEECVNLKGHVEGGRLQNVAARLGEWPLDGLRHAWKEGKLRSPSCHQLLTDAPLAIGLVLVYRDVVAVAIRNATAMGGRAEEWLQKVSGEYAKVTRVIEAHPERMRVLVSYEKLLTETELVVGRLAEVFQVVDPDSIRAACRLISVSPIEYRAAVAAHKPR